jgi:exodeoxyribonuclease V alpha subunit
MTTYIIVIDSILLLSKSISVFSGLTANNERIRVVHKAAIDLNIGDAFLVEGEWEQHPKYERQIKASRVVRAPIEGRLIVPFLINRLPGIGHERAGRLIAAYGSNLGDVLSDISQLVSVASTLNSKGEPTAYSYRLAAQIYEEWDVHFTEFRTIAWFEKHGVSDPGIARKMARFLGEKAPEILDENPYALANLFRWPSVDKLALPIIKFKRGGEGHYISEERLLGAVDSVMRDRIARGHTCLPKDIFPSLLSNKLNVGQKSISRAVELAISRGAVIDGGDRWRAPGCAFMEDDLLSRFQEMASGRGFGIVKTAVAVPPEETIKKLLSGMRFSNGNQLHQEQLHAATRILTQELAILHGGAGTGKTTVIKAIADAWESFGGRVELVALAGKAALRLSKSTNRMGRTIFRMLRGLGKYTGRAENCDLPVLDDRTLLIIDEAGMVDLGLLHQIHQSMPLGCRLLMVGDTSQLPPIGFGLVFHEIAKDEMVTSNLTQIHRQTEQSGIPVVADAIRNRRMPHFTNYNGVGDGVSFVECFESSIASEVKRVVTELGSHNEDHDLMVCTARIRGEAGVDGLNETFSLINARIQGVEPVKGFLKQWFLPNDPVVYLRNNYQIGLYNGSMGWVVSIDRLQRSVTAVFNDGEVPVEHTFSGPDLIYLKLAYGITCHKAQGSQAMRIVIPLTNTSSIDPTWLYTAITRAEAQCVLVGSFKTLQAVLKRDCAYKNRQVGFRWLN